MPEKAAGLRGLRFARSDPYYKPFDRRGQKAQYLSFFMKDTLLAILNEVSESVAGISSRPDFERFKATISGPNGKLTAAMKLMREVPKEEKPAIGKLINETKQQIESFYDDTLAAIERAEVAAKLGPAIDPTLPSPDSQPGSLHPLTQTRRRMVEVFRKIGFTVAESSEIETEWFCFDALNTPADHPARDEQDTLFVNDNTAVTNVSRHDADNAAGERYLLRTHTSSVQIRTMIAEKPPLRIVAPGRVFRRDTVDATHSANFHQFEGLCIDEDVTLVDLKAVLDFFVKELFGDRVEIRLRPSFFPFTEPSFEMDMRSPSFGKLSNKWIEMMGCGLVDPKVLEAVDLDPEHWSGYAFGIGIERIAMLLHGIDDIRHFYLNDERFLEQFR